MSYLEIKIFFHKLVDFEKKLVNFPLFHSCLYASRNDPWIVKNSALAKVEKNLFCISRDHMINESRKSVGEIISI